jgi:hypothetical protein
MASATSTPTERAAAGLLRVEFLFLDLTTCTRCRGTDRALTSALELAGERLAARGARVELDKIEVSSAEQARELRFVSSPTIRINGRDVALELRESSCGSESCTDGCGDSIACRVWVHDGREYTEPPVAMIVDAMLREVHGQAAVEPDATAAPYELPENLERFFAGTDATGSPQAEACCSPSEQLTCCPPDEKAECCGATSGEACGCQ